MTEWWTYSLRDLLMFSQQTYFRLFELYNTQMWPAQIFMLALGVGILLLWHRGGKQSGRAIAAVLASCWLWIAWAFHWQRYADINLAANYFGFAFLIEALLLTWLGLFRNKLVIAAPTNLRKQIGLGILLYALFIHPLIGPLFGRPWVQAEIFGMTPDPTALATLGLLVIYGSRSFWPLAPIPILWCLVSGTTLWVMDSSEFFIAPVAAFLCVTAMGPSLLKRTAP